MNKPLVIAHRGGSLLAPENTLSAITSGLNTDADAIEFDIRFTKDHIPVLFHDETLKRVTQGKYKAHINALRYKELATIDVGSFFHDRLQAERIPTLQAALNMIDDRKQIFLEIKDNKPELCSIIVDTLRVYKGFYRIKVLSFHEDVLEKIKMLDSSIETIFLFSKKPHDVHHLLRNMSFDNFGINVNLALASRNIVYKLLDANRDVYCYPVNEEKQVSTLLKMAVTGLITDNPITTINAIKRRK